MNKGGFWSAVFTFLGVTIGAGIFGIPYVIAKTGFLIGVVYLVLLGFLMLMISLYTGEIILRTKEKHQLTGLAGFYLGTKGKYLMFFSVLISIYGALTAYVVAGGEALQALFHLHYLTARLLFFIPFSLFLLFKLDLFSLLEDILSPAKILMVLFFTILALPQVHGSLLSGVSTDALFAPFGVILFSYIGVSALPEMSQELKNKKQLKPVLLLGMGLVFLIYFLYALAVVGTGAATSELTILSLGTLLGAGFGLLAHVFSLLALSSAYLGLGFALKETFKLDFHWSNTLSWAAVWIIPLLLFVLNGKSFVTLLEVSGILGGGIMLLLLLLIHTNAIKHGTRTPEYTVPNSFLLKSIFIFILVLGIMYEVSLFF